MRQLRRLHEGKTLSWVKKLRSAEDDITVKDIEEFIAAVDKNDPQAFAVFVEFSIGKAGGDGMAYENPDGLTHHVTDRITFALQHMKLMPVNDMIVFKDNLGPQPLDNVTSPYVTSPYFWGARTIELLAEGRILPWWLAHRDKMIYRHLVARSPRRTVRRVIRTLCGPGVFRGAPELYVDCALAKAWWCAKLSEITGNKIGKTQYQIASALSPLWTAFAACFYRLFTQSNKMSMLTGIVYWITKNNERLTKAEIRKRLPTIAKGLGSIAVATNLDSYGYMHISILIDKILYDAFHL